MENQLTQYKNENYDLKQTINSHINCRIKYERILLSGPTPNEQALGEAMRAKAVAQPVKRKWNQQGDREACVKRAPGHHPSKPQDKRDASCPKPPAGPSQPKTSHNRSKVKNPPKSLKSIVHIPPGSSLKIHNKNSRKRAFCVHKPTVVQKAGDSQERLQ